MKNTELYKQAEQHIKALKRLKEKHNKTLHPVKKYKMQQDIEIITIEECKKIASDVVFLECNQSIKY